MFGQGIPAAPAPQQPTAKAPAATPAPAAPAPLQLHSLGSETQADPFPPVNPKNFTADSPSVATVDSYLHAMVGFDPNRMWRVAAIQKTAAAGVSKVTVLISERGPNAKVLSAVFFVLPDGKHLIGADAQNVTLFGATPFADNRALLEARADGPARGAAGKQLLLVEFADLQCPHCKDAQATMERLAQDFPGARIVYQPFPLTDIHPYAFEAAAYGLCVAKQKPDGFSAYQQAVYDTQGGLLPDSYAQILKNAVIKAGADPVTVAACASSDAVKSSVTESVKLGNEVGVDQTPMLALNGRLLALGSVPYETLKSLIAYQAQLDGVSGVIAAQ